MKGWRVKRQVGEQTREERAGEQIRKVVMDGKTSRISVGVVPYKGDPRGKVFIFGGRSARDPETFLTSALFL